ncbi:hypothetical protein [Paenibacillus apiarius]|uniref:hypothetical protein n=1 Tax=Paenibacillus apiarius TaxID=46240 RepID=UPI003B3A7A7D
MAETDNLKLYKADPVADADKTFNIDTMLNNNWDKIDAAVQDVKNDVSNIDLSKITPESIGAETPAGAQEKADAAAAASVPRVGAANKEGTLAVIADAATLNLYGFTHSYMTFSLGDARHGYIGPSDPDDLSKLNIVSEKGDLRLYSKAGSMVTLNDRDVLGEIDSLKQSGVSAKQAVVDAINAQGGQASTNDTWEVLSQKIRAISTGIKNNYMLLYYRYFLDGDTAPVFTHGWAQGYISGNTGNNPDNSTVRVYPDNGFVNVHAGNRRQPGRAQVITQQPVDLTNVGYIEFGIDPYATKYKQGLYVTVGVTPTLNPAAINYSRYSRFDLGSLADKQTVSLDVRDLSGMHYVGMDTEATVFDMYVDYVNFFAVRLIQGR